MKPNRTIFRTVTLSLDTNVYAAGDVLADSQIISNAFRDINDGATVHSLEVIDKDDQGAAFDVYLLDGNVAMGTENAAPSISDTNLEKVMARIQVSTGDYYDLGGGKIADLQNLGRIVVPIVGTRDMYVAVVNGTGTPTYTASGLVLRFGLFQD